MEPNTEIHVSATAPLALLPAAIERMIRARRRKKIAIPVVGDAGITFYLVSNWQCGGGRMRWHRYWYSLIYPCQ